MLYKGDSLIITTLISLEGLYDCDKYLSITLMKIPSICNRSLVKPRRLPSALSSVGHDINQMLRTLERNYF